MRTLRTPKAGLGGGAAGGEARRMERGGGGARAARCLFFRKFGVKYLTPTKFFWNILFQPLFLHSFLKDTDCPIV
jgi:hypothetical protein